MKSCSLSSGCLYSKLVWCFLLGSTISIIEKGVVAVVSRDEPCPPGYYRVLNNDYCDFKCSGCSLQEYRDGHFPPRDGNLFNCRVCPYLCEEKDNELPESELMNCSTKDSLPITVSQSPSQNISPGRNSTSTTAESQTTKASPNIVHVTNKDIKVGESNTDGSPILKLDFFAVFIVFLLVVLAVTLAYKYWYKKDGKYTFNIYVQPTWETITVDIETPLPMRGRLLILKCVAGENETSESCRTWRYHEKIVFTGLTPGTDYNITENDHDMPLLGRPIMTKGPDFQESSSSYVDHIMEVSQWHEEFQAVMKLSLICQDFQSIREKIINGNGLCIISGLIPDMEYEKTVVYYKAADVNRTEIIGECSLGKIKTASFPSLIELSQNLKQLDLQALELEGCPCVPHRNINVNETGYDLLPTSELPWNCQITIKATGVWTRTDLPDFMHCIGVFQIKREDNYWTENVIHTSCVSNFRNKDVFLKLRKVLASGQPSQTKMLLCRVLGFDEDDMCNLCARIDLIDALDYEMTEDARLTKLSEFIYPLLELLQPLQNNPDVLINDEKRLIYRETFRTLEVLNGIHDNCPVCSAVFQAMHHIIECCKVREQLFPRG